jgi:outer membrane protein OmpA-like peptidoglycan-associated protein
MRHIRANLALAITASILWPAIAAAQESEDLMSLDRGSLEDEVQERYDAALALTTSQAVVAANSSQFMWASQAKDQCGIALGFLKSGTKDPVSVGKCADAATQMRGAVIAAAPPEGPPLQPCSTGPYIVFFDWDQFAITQEAVQILESAAAANTACNNAPINIAGYADRSGSDAYNQGLSARRAEAVRAFLTSRNVGAAIGTEAFGENNPRVPTADGVRELQNRRVEITFR